ncbi:MAG: alpha/beta hydrolase fold domain-containing protein [Verrucomicrobiales bacterium]|nr:alpha/beta hydrolase fold domain-containing protein [Verrucomicrobiales bacterium]
MKEIDSPKKSLRRRIIRGIVIGIGLLLILLGTSALSLWWYLNPTIHQEKGVVYGDRNGYPLTFDVLTPEHHRNGKGIVFLVSGKWKSNPSKIRPWIVGPILRQGFTVFAVCHRSQPEASIIEINEDIHRAVRTIRHDASRWKIDPDHLGASGGSSGGHLSLMLATQGGPGDPNSSDPIERESSEVQAVAIFFPVTDLLNLGASTENAGDGGPPKSFRNAFGPGTENLAVWKEVGGSLSPILHVTPSMPPILIFHGDADTLVPVDQSLRFQEEARKKGLDVEVILRPGKSHGWITMPLDIYRMGAWFKKHL